MRVCSPLSLNSESGLSVEDFLCALPYCGFSLLQFLKSNLVQNVCECFSIASDRCSCCSVKAPLVYGRSVASLDLNVSRLVHALSSH